MLTLEQSPIANPEGAASAVRIAANANNPEQFRREMRDKTARFILPTKPDGTEYGKDCFWREFQQKFVWHRAWMGTPEQKRNAAEWLRKQREQAQRRGAAWPPNPLPFRAAVTLPQAWSGKDEKPGRVPRTGKE